MNESKGAQADIVTTNTIFGLGACTPFPASQQRATFASCDDERESRRETRNSTQNSCPPGA